MMSCRTVITLGSLLLMPWAAQAAIFQVYPADSISAAVSQAQAGDTVLIHAGSYHEAITLPRSGQEQAPITIMAGSGETVWLDGSQAIGTWQACTSAATCGGNPNWASIYSANVPESVGVFSANLFEGNTRLALAQTPNPANPIYYNVPTASWLAIEDANYTDTQLVNSTYFTQTASDFWKGAYVMLWSGNNNIFYRLVNAYYPGEARISYEHTTDALANRDTFSLLNHLSLIDQPGEYVIDEQNHRVFLWPHAVSQLEQVTVSTLTFGIYINSQSYIVINGLKFRRYSAGLEEYNLGVAIRSHSTQRAAYITVKNCEVTQNGVQGYPALNMGGIDYGVAENNYIYDCPTAGIYFSGSTGRGHVVGNIIRNNRIEHGNGTCIRLYTAKNSLIENNILRDNNGQHANGITCYLDCQDITIRGNWVENSNNAITLNTIKNFTITHNLLKDGPTEGSSTLLVCWDGLAENVLIDHNTLVNAKQAGISVPTYGKNIVISNNIVDGILLPGTTGAQYQLLHNLYIGTAWNMNEAQRGAGWQRETDLSRIFADNAASDFRPRASSVAASMSTTGSYVGAFSPAGTILEENPANLSTDFEIVYPNPVRNIAQFAFKPKGEVRVILTIYNILGERVAKIEKTLSLIDSKVVWDAATVAAGGYIYTIQQNQHLVKTGKIFVK